MHDVIWIAKRRTTIIMGNINSPPSCHISLIFLDTSDLVYLSKYILMLTRHCDSLVVVIPNG